MIQNGIEVFLIFLRLGLTSFGGPVAHLGYFHHEFVLRRRWFDEHSFADILALCQFLPGPASSQLGIAIGLSRAGILGSFLAWLGFTMPSALVMILLSFGLKYWQGNIAGAWLHGLKVAVVPIVAQAIWSMTKKLSIGKVRVLITICSAIGVFLFPFGYAQLSILIVAGGLGMLLLGEGEERPHLPLKLSLGKRAASFFLVFFFASLFVLPMIAELSHSKAWKLFSDFFRVGSLVFGGGHVVLPLLKTVMVTPGWVSSDSFLIGYGAAQAIPGPLFTFCAYLGAVSQVSPNGWSGGLLCLAAAFLPSFFLVFGTIPFWEVIRRNRKMRTAMSGINAAVVGLLLAAFCNPVCTNTILSLKDMLLAISGLFLLQAFGLPSWALVLLTMVACGFLG